MEIICIITKLKKSPFDTDKPFIGTTRYGSIAAH